MSRKPDLRGSRVDELARKGDDGGHVVVCAVVILTVDAPPLLHCTKEEPSKSRRASNSSMSKRWFSETTDVHSQELLAGSADLTGLDLT